MKSAFSLMINNLRQIDTVSIVVYGGVNGVWLTQPVARKKRRSLNPLRSWKPADPHPARAAYAPLTGWQRAILSRAAPTG
ncbi:MAG: hypothetical protein WDM78_10370 [Puia sp.]